MLHELLVAYLGRVERTIRECGQAYVEQYVEEILTPERTNLRIRLVSSEGICWRSVKRLSSKTVVSFRSITVTTVRMDPIV